MAENVPEPTQSFEWVSDFIAPGFGVFLGVVAGALVQFGLAWLYAKRHEKQSVRNLKFELEFNIKKCAELISEVRKLRNSVNANSVGQYFGYFKTSDILVAIVDEMLKQGLLYKYLTHDDIWNLQKHYVRFATTEQWYNQQVANMKVSSNQQDNVILVDLIEEHFVTAEKDLKIIHDKIKV